MNASNAYFVGIITCGVIMILILAIVQPGLIISPNSQFVVVSAEKSGNMFEYKLEGTSKKGDIKLVTFRTYAVGDTLTLTK